MKSNRKIETRGLRLFDKRGIRIKFEEEEIKIEELVKLISESAYKEIKIDKETSYWAISFVAKLKRL